MGVWITIHDNPDNILISIDLKNIYNAIWREVVIERHRRHKTLRSKVPYWRAHIEPRSPT